MKIPVIDRLNIRRRLTLCFVVIISLMLVGNGLLFWQFHLLHCQADRLTGVSQKLIAILRLHTGLLSFDSKLNELAQSENVDRLAKETEPLRAALVEESQGARNTLTHLPADIQLEPAFVPTLEAIESTLPSQVEAITSLAKSGDWKAVRLRLANENKPLEAQTSALVTRVEEQVSVEQAQALLQAALVQQRIFLIVSLTGVFTLLFAAFLGLAITRSIIGPLGRLIEGSRSLAQGDFQHRVVVAGNDELAHLGGVFNDTAEKLSGLYDTLRLREAYLAEAQKLSHTGSFGWNVSTGEIHWSAETFRIFDYEPVAKVTPEMIIQRTHPEDRFAVQQLIERVSRERKEWDFEHRLLMPDGSVKYLRVIGQPSLDKMGRFEFVGAVSDVTAQKLADERHQGDQRQIRRIIDAMPQLIVVLAPDGTALYGNQAVADYGGYASEEMQGDFFKRAFHPDDVERLKEERQQALARGLPFKLEQRALRKNGQYRWFEFLFKPVIGEDGQVLRWYATGTDIEDRKQAEERVRNENLALREDVSKQQLLSLAQKAARAMAFDWYIQQDRNVWSPEQEALYGLAPGTFDGKYETWKKLIHPEDWPLILKAVKHSHETGDISAEFRVVWPDGSIHWLAANGQMFMDADGKPFRMVGFTSDITPRKRAEEELRRSEGYLAEAQHLTRCGSWAWNVHTHDLFWSQEMFRIFDYEPGKIKPTMSHFMQRVHPEDRAFLEERARRESTDPATGDSEGDYRVILSNGTIRHLHSIAHSVTNESGEITEVVGTTMDVTQQHQARVDLETAFEQIHALKDQLYKENIALREEIDRSSMFEEIVGESPALQAVLGHVVKVAPTDSTVLITGETGTGKELIARAIHKRSQRAARAFVSVNCAVIPASLIASELFGHEKGAFTGAVQRRLGRFELAEGGTIFLDEIGELPPEVQVALLRVLQEREFERVGGSKVIRANVRVIAATNRDLQASIAAGAFRSDLFYRLNVFPIEVPPLRKRQEDIPLLVEYFIDRYASKAGKRIRGINRATLDRLLAYSWPGNIRELQNVIERSVIVCDGENVSIDESWLLPSPGAAETYQPGRTLLRMPASEEKQAIEAALAESQGQISGPSGAAAKLGIPPSTLDSKIKSFKINKHRYKTV